MIFAFLPLATFALLAALMFRHLRLMGYSRRDTAILVVLACVQLAAAFSASTLHALLLALALFIMAKAAMKFSAAQSARGVIALGLSLAAVQIVSPAGLLVSVIVVPTLATAHVPDASRGKNAGLFLLLLFTPLMSAAVFAYLARELQFDPWSHMAGPFDDLIRSRIFDRLNPRRSGLIDAIALIAAAFPTWWMAARSRRAGVVAIIVCALIAAVVAAALMQRSYAFGAFVPALGSLSLLAIAEIADRPYRAIALSAASAIFSWLLLAVSL